MSNPTKGNPIVIVQGGQWGSEAKGSIAAHLCRTHDIDVAVRTGATNAGHTAYYNGKPVVLQQLPVGFVNPSTMLVLGAGALIDPVILAREVKMLNDLTGTDIRKRLIIDRRAGLHLPVHADRSKESGRHHSMGATGKGCSEALVDRIMGRGTGYQAFGNTPYANEYDVCNTEALLNWKWDEGARILLEGTQGQLLDLYLGPYPYVTHKQTGPAQWMLEAGLSPGLPTEIHMVVRTHPIRVAGNSGPMDDEISWPILARRINAKRDQLGLPGIVSEPAICAFEAAVRSVATGFRLPYGSDGLDQHQWPLHARVEFKEALSELHKEALLTLPASTVAELRRLFEMTTVTRKLRRIAMMSESTLCTSARQIRPDFTHITFMNYEFPQFWYETPGEMSEISDPMVVYIDGIGHATHSRIASIGFGPDEERHLVDLIHAPVR